MTSFKQDMPPPGGYSRIIYEKVPSAAPWTGKKTFAIVGVLMAIGAASTIIEKRYKRKIWLLRQDQMNAMEPLMLAEQHRNYLRQMRANRDEENELMKNVPGWVTGTWFGEPVYNNDAKRFIQANYMDYYMHRPMSEMYNHFSERQWH